MIKNAHRTKQKVELELNKICVMLLLKKINLAFYPRDHLM